MGAMRKFVFMLAVCLLVISCKRDFDTPNIIPAPVSMVQLGGTFTIGKSTLICYEDSILQNVASYFQDLLTLSGVVVQIQSLGNVPAPKNSVVFRLVAKSELGAEGYKMGVTNDLIQVESNGAEGAFYAVQTLRQLMPQGFEGEKGQFKSLSIPCVQIADYPKFAWRGFHLDCCRHFMDKEFVMRYVDLLAYHKMNTLHWHLSDDQGWRIEIEAFPNLTDIGAWRTGADGSRYGGYYTKEDIREIVAYAAERYVNIVPEIEMPGHAVAAIAAYPELSCTGKKINVETSWGVFKDIFCAGNEQTYSFLETVLEEVVELFPSTRIHIGGDEAPKYRWENCPKCRALLKKEGLKSYEDMQRYFIERIGKFLRSKGRTIIGWDEIMDGGLPQNATVQAWRGMDKVREALEKQASVIAMPTSHCYFDYPVGVTDLRRVYTFDPIPEGISAERQKLILGGECALWSEHSPQSMVDSKVFPRILAVSEVLWTYPANRNYSSFRNRVRRHYARLAELGVHYGFEQSAVEFHNKLAQDCSSMEVAIESGQEYFNIRYTTDGKKPTPQSDLYKAPIVLKASAMVRAAAFSGNVQVDEVFENNVVLSKTTGRPVVLGYMPAKQYMGGGANALVDGRKGTGFYNDGVWQAVQGTANMQATVNLGQPQVVTKFSVGFLQSNPSWIFMPSRVDFYVSVDGEIFTKVAQVLSPVKPNDGGNIVYNFEAQVEPISCRFVRMEATSIGPCPEWHPAAGSPSWLFADELVVE